MQSQMYISPYAIISTGLINLGNTCYMNAVLQALFNCQRLKTVYMNLPISVQSQRSTCLSDRFRELICALASSEAHSLRPSDLLECIRTVNHTFRGFQQQDAQEFMRAFLYELHEEIKIVPIPELHFMPQPAKKRHRPPCGDTRIEYMEEECPSVIMDIFQGSILSSVECLSCHTISHREEMFIDLSVPVTKPHKPYLTKDSLEEQHLNASTLTFTDLLHCSLIVCFAMVYCLSRPTLSYSSAEDGFNDIPFYVITIMFIVSCHWRDLPRRVGRNVWTYLKSFFITNEIHLTDCLQEFFNEDSLTGENSYHCKRCNAASHGVKTTRLFHAPEVLCIHLKRFRSEFSNSSKVCSPVRFPLKNLDMSPYISSTVQQTSHTDIDANLLYNLSSVICHLGTCAGSGHYICFAHNSETNCWYEYDDEMVNMVDHDTVLSHVSNAYVLIYGKQVGHMAEVIQRAEELYKRQTSPSKQQMHDPGYYLSKYWLVKFTTFANPGPLTTHEFLCPHLQFQPFLWRDRTDAITNISTELWIYFTGLFGSNDPPVRELTSCNKCYDFIQALVTRRQEERDRFLKIKLRAGNSMCLISQTWYNAWRDFVMADECMFKAPGRIDNSKLTGSPTTNLNNPLSLLQQSSSSANAPYDTLPEACYDYLHSIYGGGPKIFVPSCKSNWVDEVDHDDDDDEEFNPNTDDEDSVANVDEGHGIAKGDASYDEMVQAKMKKLDEGFAEPMDVSCSVSENASCKSSNINSTSWSNYHKGAIFGIKIEESAGDNVSSDAGLGPSDVSVTEML